MKKHDHDFDLPYYENKSEQKKTPCTPYNPQRFKDKVVETTLNGKRIEGTYRNNQKVIHYVDSRTKRYVVMQSMMHTPKNLFRVGN